ncbi:MULTISPECIES: DNA/RNA non-specific endonuclease [Vagococcus]|uniref:DNA/RNA non-specific endonuclease n=1 Tax=Vagococcus TaxID=2737 RepID=UPI002FC97D16
MVKKQAQKNSFNPKTALVVLVIVLALAISGKQFPEIMDIILGNEPQVETKEAAKSQKGDNPGPIENGQSTFTKEELTDSKKGWITYGKLDALNRPTTANALITPDMIGTGTGASQDIRPPGFISGLDPHNHSRGHLIGKQLGGTGEDLKNLVTLYQNPVNTPFMTKYENMVRKAADEGDTIRYRVAPIYDGDIGMPIAVDMEAKSLHSNKIDFNVRIENKK